MALNQLAVYLKTYKGRPLRLMEVCGTHTAILYRSGIRTLLSPAIHFLSGPGCPICVTPTSYIDKLVELSLQPHTCILSFGDLLGVPGSRESLLTARTHGGCCDFFYQPEEALERAQANPDTTFILAAVGFETTAPVWAVLAQEILGRKLTNLKFLTALKTMPAAMAALGVKSGLDGFLCPGHVAVIIGSQAFQPLSDICHLPMVIGGFTSEKLLPAVARLVHEAAACHEGVWNEYADCVTVSGNIRAQQLLKEVFEAGSARWRGLSIIPYSGLYLQGKYAVLDAGSRELVQDQVPDGCCCSLILTGKMNPTQCPLFGRQCCPEHPVGACMVSQEGSCRIVFYEEHRQPKRIIEGVMTT